VSNRSYRHVLERVPRGGVDEKSSSGLRRASISSTKCRDPQSAFEAGAGYQGPAHHSIAARANHVSGGSTVKSVLEEDSVVGASSIDKTITARPERRESLNLRYFTPIFICSLLYGAYELGVPSRQHHCFRMNKTEHSGPPKCPDKDCEYHEDALPREKGRDRHELPSLV
jgi:hypothetical protein